MAVYLNAAAYDDNTYRMEGGRLCKNLNSNECVPLTNDTYLIVQPGDGLVFMINGVETPIDLWDLVVQTGLTKHFYQHHQMYIDGRFLHAIEMYYMREGYADLSLAEFVGKIYGIQQGDEVTSIGRNRLGNGPKFRRKGSRL